MFKKNILTSGLSVLTLSSILFTPVVMAEESTSPIDNVTLTEGLEPIHRTAIHPINAQELIAAGYVGTYKDILRSAGITDATLSQLSEDTLRQGAFNYLIIAGVEEIDLDEAIRSLTYLVPDLLEINSNTSSESTEPEVEDLTPPEPMTYEEAVEYVNSGFLETFIGNLHYFGITDEMLATLPEDAPFKAAVNYWTNTFLGGDPYIFYTHFIRMYPEVLTNQPVKETDAERQARMAETTEKQEQLSQHVQSWTSSQADSLEPLPFDYSFETDQGIYHIDYIFVLTPEEAGNQSPDHYMLGIEYTFENTSDETVSGYVNNFYDHTQISQIYPDGSIILSPAPYRLPGDDPVMEPHPPVDANDSVTHRVHYLLNDRENPAAISILTDNGIQDFDLGMEDLMKYPLQSAVYTSDKDLGYLFDFNTIYYFESDSSEYTPWDDLEGIETGNFDSLDLSPEALIQADKLDGTDYSVVKLEGLKYHLSEDGSIEALQVDKDSKDEQVYLTFKTDSGWVDFTDGDNNFLYLVR